MKRMKSQWPVKAKLWRAAALLCAAVLAGCAHPPRGAAPTGAPAGEPIRVLIRTQGGDRISGVTRRTELRFLTDLGEATLPLRDLRTVRSGETAGRYEAVARNGSRISGAWREDDALPVETGYGIATVQLQQVRELTIVSEARFLESVLWLDFDSVPRLPGAPAGEFDIAPPARRADGGAVRRGVLELPDKRSGQILPGGFENRAFEALTVMAWFRPDAFTPDQQVILSSLAPNGNDGGFQLFLGERRLEFEARLPASFRIQARAAFPDPSAGAWFHGAAVFDRDSMGSARLRIFVNGEPNGEARLTWQGPIFHAGQPAHIGMNYDAAHAGSGRSFPREFVGQLDELIVLDRALSDEEIRAYFERSR